MFVKQLERKIWKLEERVGFRDVDLELKLYG